MPSGLNSLDQTYQAGPCCCGRQETKASLTADEQFFENVASKVIEDGPKNGVTIDTKRIYMAGHSNGCISAIAMGTLHSDWVAAVACHAGVAQAVFPTDYQPTPMWIAHGTGDTAVNYEGERKSLSAEETHTIIAQKNGCKSIKVTEPIKGGAGTKIVSDDCTNGATVVLFALNDVGHFPYQGLKMDGPNVYVDTTEEAWNFLKSHSLNEAPTIIRFGDEL